MVKRALVALLVLGGLVGCQSEEQLKKMQVEMGDMKMEVFKLRRQMEESNQKQEAEFAAADEGRKLDRRFQADLQDTLRQLQDSTRNLNGRLQEVPSRRAGKGSPAPEPQAPVQDDEKALQSVLLDYNRGNYALAAESLDLFVKSNPGTSRKSDALFYLGLSHYNLKAYDKAKAVFEQLLKEHPTSNQFLPAKLKRAQCLKWLGLKPAAIQAFKEIKSGFPSTSEARTAQQELEDLGA
ncbi:MAG: ybgF [Holophagaceae bacterium]|nr:ybgF [Holophagaceae bacterium]